MTKALQEVKAREGGDGIDEPDGMESNDESFKFVNEAAKPVHIKSAVSVRPVYIKRPWHASHHKGHTSLRSSDRWANNWPKQDKGQCCIKSKLRQKYTTTEWKYPTSDGGNSAFQTFDGVLFFFGSKRSTENSSVICTIPMTV